MDIHFVTESFFDAQKVLRAVGTRKRKAFGRAGAFVRRRSQSLIGNKVSRKTPARPAGLPPRNRTGKLRKSIYFAWDFTTESVWIGPVLFPRGRGRGLILTGRTVPEALEYGGAKAVRRQTGPVSLASLGVTRDDKGRLRDASGRFVTKTQAAQIWKSIRERRKNPAATVAKDAITINTHPFMNPALATETAAGTIAAAWRHAN